MEQAKQNDIAPYPPVVDRIRKTAHPKRAYVTRKVITPAAQLREIVQQTSHALDALEQSFSRCGALYKM